MTQIRKNRYTPVYSRHFAEWKRPVSKDDVLYDSTDNDILEIAKWQRKE